MSNSTIDEERLIIEIERELPIEEIYIEKYKDNVQTKQVKENNMCLICRDETNTKISCNHDFHEECINRWIRESNNNLCPYCRKEIEIEKIKIISIDWENLFQDKVHWKNISQKLSEEFIEKFQDKVHWYYISRYQKLSEEFIEKFQDKVHWYYISSYQKLSEEFIEKFQDKVSLVKYFKIPKTIRRIYRKVSR